MDVDGAESIARQNRSESRVHRRVARKSLNFNTVTYILKPATAQMRIRYESKKKINGSYGLQWITK
jgi:hypothetical protein